MQRRETVISRLVYNAGRLNTVVSSLVFPCFVVCLWGSCWTCVLAFCAAEIARSYLSLESAGVAGNMSTGLCIYQVLELFSSLSFFLFIHSQQVLLAELCNKPKHNKSLM